MSKIRLSHGLNLEYRTTQAVETKNIKRIINSHILKVCLLSKKKKTLYMLAMNFRRSNLLFDRWNVSFLCCPTFLIENSLINCFFICVFVCV